VHLVGRLAVHELERRVVRDAEGVVHLDGAVGRAAQRSPDPRLAAAVHRACGIERHETGG